MIDLSLIIALGTFVFTLTNFIRFFLATNWSSALAQLIAWASGILATFVVAHTQLATSIAFGSKSLNTLDIPSQAIVGLAAASSIGIVYQFKQALDSTDTAKVASLSESKILNFATPDRTPGAADAAPMMTTAGMSGNGLVPVD